MVYNRIYRAKRILSQIGYYCSFCGLACSDSGICPTCATALLRSSNCCTVCGNALTTASQIGSSTMATCGSCLKQPPPYHSLIAACYYQSPVKQAISAMKFHQQLHFTRSLSSLLLTKLEAHYQKTPLPQQIVSVPLHRMRLANRGFNQAELIASHLSAFLSVPLRSSSLKRVKNTPHQIGLDAKQRRKNLHQAFIVKAPLAEYIAIVDDVVTTGSTIKEVCKTCLRAGTKQIDVWCLAKT